MSKRHVSSAPQVGRRTVLRMMAGSAALMVPRAVDAAGKTYLVYIATYTTAASRGGNSKGIYVSRFDSSTGKLSQPELAAESVDPSWVLLHPNGRILYAVNEPMSADRNADPPAGSISVFTIDRKTGKLTEIQKLSSEGLQPCHLCFDKTTKMLIVANWYSASVAGFPIGKDGKLGKSSVFFHEEGERSGPAAPGKPQDHCHSVTVTPDNRFLLVSNTGLNKVFVYKLDPAKMTFTPNDPPFLGLTIPVNPRHLALHPNAKWAYVCHEIAPGGCTMLKFDAAKGVLEQGPTVACVPPNTERGGTQAECMIHPSGKFVYVSNRGHNSIAVFSINQQDGSLTLQEAFAPGGTTPRSFGLDPTGNWLFSLMQGTGELKVLKIDQATGKLTDTGEKFKMDAPVGAAFLAV